MTIRIMTAALIAATTLSTNAVADGGGSTFFIRIGDIDGFGLGDGAGLLNFEGDPVNVDGLGVLAAGDFLPDWNGNGDVMHFSGDDFDQRTGGELNNTDTEFFQFINLGCTGAAFTDLTLSQSYDATYGTPNNFPDPPSSDRNDVSAIFNFGIPVNLIESCEPIYFNIVFADIGGGASSRLDLTFFDGSTESVNIQPINPNVEDGLIRDAFVELEFDDVFTLDGGNWHGYVEVQLVTLPNQSNGDPYYTVDFIEISTDPILECDGDINLDLTVNVDDILLLLSVWGPYDDPCGEAARADVDDNGIVNVDDLLTVLGEWGDC